VLARVAADGHRNLHARAGEAGGGDPGAREARQ